MFSRHPFLKTAQPRRVITAVFSRVFVFRRRKRRNSEQVAPTVSQTAELAIPFVSAKQGAKSHLSYSPATNVHTYGHSNDDIQLSLLIWLYPEQVSRCVQDDEEKERIAIMIWKKKVFFLQISPYLSSPILPRSLLSCHLGYSAVNDDN